MNRIVAVDTETMGLNPHGPNGCRPFAFSFTHYDGTDFYIRFQVDPFTRRVKYEEDPASFQLLKEFFADESITKIFHNAQFDLQMLTFAGMPCRGKFFDTRILAHVANSSRPSFALKPLSKSLFDYPDDDQKVLKDSVKKARREGKKLGYLLAEDVEADYSLGDPELCKTYAIGDTRRTMALYKFYEPLLNGNFTPASPYYKYSELVQMEHSLVPIVMAMSKEGVALSLSKAVELDTYYTQCIVKAREQMTALGYPDLNPKSTQQKMKVFYEDLKLPKVYRKRKQEGSLKKVETLTCDKATLDKWSAKVPLAKCLVEMSEAQHQLNSFITPFQENSFNENRERVLHPSFNTCGPITGRLSCSKPNLQNITSSTSPGRKSEVEFRARECFIPRPGTAWVLADYSQVELWVAAFLSKDALMMKTLQSGESVHDLTCNRVFGHKGDFLENKAMYRKMAKIVNFSILYGSGPGALSELLNVPFLEAKNYLEAYWSTYPGLSRCNDLLKAQAKENGWIQDFFGRTYFPKHPHKALNYVIQGGAAGILKRAMIAASAFLEAHSPMSKLLLSIHDELVFEVNLQDITPAFLSGIKQAMQGNFHTLLGMPEPFQIEISVTETNWADKSKITEEDLVVLHNREEE